jgi:hypothetical protein
LAFTKQISFGDAEEWLLQYSLINKDTTDRSISVHRLVQATTLERMSENERKFFFDIAVQLLSWGFPDTWSKDIGHQIAAWKKCEICLPHIEHITKQLKAYKIHSEDEEGYAELLLRTSW